MKKNFYVLFVMMLAVGVILACGGGATVPAATEAPAVDAPAATEVPAVDAPAATEAPAVDAPAATEAPAAASKGGVSPMPGASDLSESDRAAIDPIVTSMTPRLSGGLEQNGYDAYAMPADTAYADVIAYYQKSGVDLGASDTDDLGNGVRGAGWGTTQIDNVLLYIPLADKVVIATVHTK